MLRTYQPKLGIVGLLAILGMALAATFGAAAAQAEGPLWIYLNDEPVPAGTTLAIRGENHEASVFKLKSTVINIECLKLVVITGSLTTKVGSFIFGGSPGTDLEELEFRECSLENKNVTECGATSSGMEKGVILTNVRTALAYPDGKFAETAEAYDLVFPDEGSENLFAIFTLSGTNCGLLNNHVIEVFATGTKVIEAKKEAFNAKCGVIGLLGLLNAEKVFVVAKSGELVLDGVVKFDGSAVTEAEMLALTLPEPEQKEEVRTLVTCGLETLDKTSSIKAIGSEEGEALVEVLEGGVPIEFGWEV